MFIQDSCPHLVSLANHAQRNMSEGGFCVQNINDKPIISPLFNSPQMGSIEDAERSFSTMTNSRDYDS